MTYEALRRRCRFITGLFIVGLVLSGITAFPLLHELELLAQWAGVPATATPDSATGLQWWFGTIRDGLRVVHRDYPWLPYGTDWLAFGHIVIALFFVGPWINPVANAWVFKVGLVACAGVIPVALICGPIRGIPFYWQMIDCSFGVIGAIPLLYCLFLAQKMKQADPAAAACDLADSIRSELEFFRRVMQRGLHAQCGFRSRFRRHLHRGSTRVCPPDFAETP